LGPGVPDPPKPVVIQKVQSRHRLATEEVAPRSWTSFLVS
jgi:hypothetical protein